MRFFNTAGPVKPELHYCLPPLERLDLSELLNLIEQQKYFVLHAPRQTGKTSCLLALLDHLNAQGAYRCVYANLELGQADRENIDRAMRSILGELGLQAQLTLADDFVEEVASDLLLRHGGGGALNAVLTASP